jgi:hypothetical protein
MDGYSVTEAASVLGVPTERVWELLARGILAGTPEGETGMRVFLQPRPGAPPADPLRERGQNGNGGTREPAPELSPFRELLTEFRSLTERYGQALLALGEARGEVASLRSRVDLLEARIDLRLPTAQSAPWPAPPMPAPPSEPARERTDLGAEPVATEEPPRRRRHRGRPDVVEIAEALARADDPSRSELPEVRPDVAAAGVASDAVEVAAEQPEAVAVEPEPVAVEPEPVAVEPEPVAVEPEPMAVEPEPVAERPEAAAVEPEPMAVEPEPVAVEPEAVAVEPEPVAVQPEPEAEIATEPADETAADVAEAAGAAEAEFIPPEETLQADGDWPAAAPTIDVADTAGGVEAPEVAAGTPEEETAVLEGEPAATAAAREDAAPAMVAEPSVFPPDTEDAGPAPEAEPSVSPPAAEEATVTLEAEQPFEAPPEPVAGVPTDEGRPAGEEQPQEWEAAAGRWTEEEAQADATGELVADVSAAEASVAPAEPSPGEPGPAESPYEAAVEEPDWFSEEDIGGPVTGEPYEPWGTGAEAATAEPRPSWAIWDTEPSAVEPAAEAEQEPPDRHDTAASTEPDIEAPAAMEAAPTAEDAAERATQPAKAREAEPSQRDQPDEEPVLWLGEPSATGAEPEEADDAAAEMEVAATGWHPAADRDTEAPRRDWRAVELPGARELDDALAALRRRARGSDPGRPAAPPPPQPASDDATTRPPAEASPAQRAYARLRRILPR